ncbi:hypothetical protein [Paucilactobacillus sp. N302-9]
MKLNFNIYQTHDAVLEEHFRYRGYECEIDQIKFGGHLCGHVIIPPNHRYFGVDYEDIPVTVHGGLTYGELMQLDPFEPESYVIGFDCAHAGDVIPKMSELTGIHPSINEHLWTVGEVKQELEQLVDQLIILNEGEANDITK